MQDVARLAGVSRTTVSFVINKVADGGIPPETQQRVWDAVAELGYRPNAIARNLRSQRTHTLGFISDSIATSPFAGQMIQGAQDYAWERQMLFLLVNVGSDAGLQARAAETLLERQVEGILFASMYHHQVTLPDAIRDIPCVLLDCFAADGGHPAVVPDEERGGREAVEYLIANGHRRIGMLNNHDRIPASLGRLQGYKAALASHGLPFEKALVATGMSDPDGGYAAAQKLLARRDRPTALFCFNDRMAMGAYQAAAEVGLSIPAELSIVGFDNQAIIAPGLRPGLTTMQLPHYEMGWRAAHLLLRQIDGAAPAQAGAAPELIPCPLVERASVTPR